MARSTTRFEKIIDLLADYYGAQKQRPGQDPFDLVLWENIAYLVSDERRGQAFEALRQRVGTRPDDILNAKRENLYKVATLGGMLPEMRVERLLSIARIAADEFGGRLDSVVKRPLREAKKAIKVFPSIGDPGAEKILLFSKSHPVMALESNGLRALVRLGFGREQKNYSSTYRSVQTAIDGQYRPDFDRLIQAHLLLRKLGQDLCRRSRPICQPCPLRGVCEYFIGGLFHWRA
jgi:endonuclease III